MDFTPTSPADVEVEAAALAAFKHRAAIYQQGKQAVNQAAASHQNTEAATNLRFLGHAMQVTTFDHSHPSAIDVAVAQSQTKSRRDGVSQVGGAMEAATRARARNIEISAQDAADMEILAPIQIRFMEMLFELAGQLSMRQMMTLCGFLCELTSSIGDRFDMVGCEGVGYYEEKGQGKGGKKDEDEEEDESSDGKRTVSDCGGEGCPSSPEIDGKMVEDNPDTWV